MFFALQPVNFHLLLAQQLSSPASATASREALAKSVRYLPLRSGLDLTKEFAGQQFVIHITKPNSKTKNFMDVDANDLLASFQFDQNGKIQDKWNWVDPQALTDSKQMAEATAVLREVFAQGSFGSVLNRDLNVKFKPQASMYALSIQPLSGDRAPMVFFVMQGHGSAVVMK